jgi:excisionase family DNA binding protein
MVIIQLEAQELATLIKAAVREVLAETENPGQAGEPEKSRVLTFDEAREFLGIAKATLYRKTSAGEIPHSKKMGRVYFDRAELEKWLLGHRINTTRDIGIMAGEHMADLERRNRNR